MEFHEFHSIQNSYREKFLDEVKMSLDSTLPWCVMEKVHGSNFSLTTDGKTVTAGKRTSFLAEEKDRKSFYNCDEILAKIAPKVKRLMNIYKLNHLDAKYLTVYGELFGGYYQGQKLQCQMIQKGVQYCPHHEFMAFDIRVVDQGENARYLNYHEALGLFHEVDLFHANILFQGNLQECLKWSAEHNTDPSTIPSRLGLEELKDNVREGHVLKPIEPAYTVHGTAIVLKDKNDKFKEKASVKKGETVTELAPEVQAVADEAVAYITEQRLDNVLSHQGIQSDNIPRNMIGKVIGLLAQDAMNDFRKENKITLKKTQMKQVTHEVQGAARRLVLSKI